MAVGENSVWSAVTHTHAAAPGSRRATHSLLLPWLSAALLVPAVMLLLAEKTPGGAGEKGELLAVQGRELAVGTWPDAATAWHPDAAAGLAQPVSRASKLAATHNVAVAMRMTELAEKAEEQVKSWAITPNDKVTVTMYMESECPACRQFSTLVIKEILDAPGVSDIVDFRPVPWGWGVILEAPTEQQLKANPRAVNVLNRTAQLLPILARLGAENATPPPMNFQCQHGPGECAGNALEACLVDVAPNHQQFFPVVDCVESRTCAEGMKPPLCVGQPSEVINGCLQDFGSDINKVDLNACYNGPRVQELMIINDLQTLKAKPQWVPWFQVDGQDLVNVPEGGNESAIFREQFLLGKKICELYVAKTGKSAPEGCASFPQNDAEIGTDPWARFKVANFSSLIATMDAERQQQQHASTLKMAAKKGNSASASTKTSHVKNPISVQEEVRAAKKRAAAMVNTHHQAKVVSSKKIQPKIIKHEAKVVASKKPEPAHSAKQAPTDMAAKVRKVSEFADHFFGHDAAHEAMAKKLIANAKKDVVPVHSGNEARTDKSAMAKLGDMAAKVRKVSEFADHFFGHDAAHEAMAKKLIANAKKDVVPVSANSLDDALNDLKADKATLKSFEAVKGKSDELARMWKPPSVHFA